MEEIKPCPFCGGEASINYERIPGENKGFWAQIICNDCHGRSGGTWAGTYSAAERIEVKKWNRRQTMDEEQERAAGLQEEIENDCIRYGLNLAIYDGGIAFVEPKESRIVAIWRPQYTR